jgi:hypothetical protein
MILVIKDHVHAGKRVETAKMTAALCCQIGFMSVAWHRRHVWPLSLWQRRRREQGKLVIETEDILVFRRSSALGDNIIDT